MADPKASASTMDLLNARKKELQAKLDALNAEAEPWRQECNKVHKDIQALYDTIAPLGEKLKANNRARAEIENELSTVCRVTGGKFMSDTGAAA